MNKPVEEGVDRRDASPGPIASLAATPNRNLGSFEPLKACRRDLPMGMLAGA